MSPRFSLVLALLLAASPAAADPAAWQISFGAGAVATHQPPGLQSVLVVAAGDAGPARDEAVAALTAAYRSANLRLVMDGQSLGDVATLADGDIVKRASHLPVTHIVVLRVYASASGPPTAVISVYDKSGAAATSFAATEGVALAAKATAEPAHATSGVSRATVDTVASVKEDAHDRVRDAKARFDREFVWFDDFLVVNQYGAVGAGAIPYQGIEKRPLDSDEFYHAVGRDDLASSYRTRRNVKVGVMFGGIVAMIAGVFVVLDQEYCEYPFDQKPGEQAAYDQCEARNSSRLSWGLGLVTVGSLASTIPLFVPSDPINLHERRQLAIEYNAGLRTSLKLDSDYVPRPMRSGLRDVKLSPFVGPGGGGLVLGGRF